MHRSLAFVCPIDTIQYWLTSVGPPYMVSSCRAASRSALSRLFYLLLLSFPPFYSSPTWRTRGTRGTSPLARGVAGGGGHGKRASEQASTEVTVSHSQFVVVFSCVEIVLEFGSPTFLNDSVCVVRVTRRLSILDYLESVIYFVQHTLHSTGILLIQILISGSMHIQMGVQTELRGWEWKVAPAPVHCSEPILPTDPRCWTRSDVAAWLRHMAYLHELPNVPLERFLMNGKALCLMSMDMFLGRVPLGGKLLYKDFQIRLGRAMYATSAVHM